ncbi:hypothetical protein WJX81_004208 [Elliptochloris bilobata]|uniref:Non-canonical E2 ubiquitin-conjugating enzyme C-terminal domain-containing protein n=1 Tax=Elliptochloris bilobata TaxID=381761 RepID=A0AAW1QK09_9CHLO
MGSAPETNHALSEVLDAGSRGDGRLDDSIMSTDLGELQEEHTARLNAEAQAADTSRRLVVAQEQVSEYAAQREKEAGEFLAAAGALEAALAAARERAAGGEASVSAGEGLDGVAAALGALQAKLAESAAEAQAFHIQQRFDAERTKRTYSQADLRDADSADVDMKRMREHSDADTSEETGEAGAAGDPSASVSDAEEENGAAAPPRRGGMADRARYIPLRLSQDERRLLRLLEAALSVSEYTDKVDIATWKSKVARVHVQIKDLCAILCALVVAQDYRRGQALVQHRSFKDNATFFQDAFEIGRRYKIQNPHKMRSEYGKLMYLLMDSAEPAIQELLEFRCVRPLRTVHQLLQDAHGLALLSDSLVERATGEIVAGERPRHEVQRDIRAKERARDILAKRYRSATLPEEAILRCLYSIADNNSYLLFNRDPVDRMVAYLRAFFRPECAETGATLAISGGMQGARLTHSHERQYHYVLQSLTLWREISHEMFKLWSLAEEDLLAEGNTYRLTNTGQGLNRVQQAAGVSRAMHAILARCQRQLGQWVGSAVIHLGDHNVPNALLFIDKYTQVPRILNPVVLVVDALPELCCEPKLNAYVCSLYGSAEGARKAILLDFFRHAFDGSGADNFFDAGSCIDGRLTSAWNWGSKIEKKAYYPIFKVAGFTSFDGQW